jgi:hypothetical protein
LLLVRTPFSPELRVSRLLLLLFGVEPLLSNTRAWLPAVGVLSRPPAFTVDASAVEAANGRVCKTCRTSQSSLRRASLVP